MSSSLLPSLTFFEDSDIEIDSENLQTDPTVMNAAVLQNTHPPILYNISALGLLLEMVHYYQ